MIPLLLISALFAGCSEPGRLIVLEAPLEYQSYKGYRLVPMRSTVNIPKELVEYFAQEIKEGLAEEGVREGDDLIIAYRFIQYEAGSRWVRCLSGGLSLVPYLPTDFIEVGGAELTVEVVFKNKLNQELGKIHVSTKLTRGFFKGSLECAIENLAAQVNRYVLASFR